ncbi:PREDICTED: urokinase plasminogen activator surface receptor isoform X2 [Chrysochloris asiatica]|uniref:Urokinase plasminogen activator surface receptor isoform X2 n=1 Tax=Chrysochloris asiatica TaxID=185453 RepID=A0A9B0TW17_CHRAS|nr:PREDICTED: urokinase plasminogen activator surface receptor isoform X2 [Chrysochloris asiatica]
MGHPRLLLLLALTCIPVSWGLQCLLCERNGPCQMDTGQDLCRTTVLRVWEEGEEQVVVEKGCAHREKTTRSMSYRTGPQIITLSETVCDSDLCNQPDPRPPSTFPRSRYLECASCASSDMSCERGRDQSLQCRNPEEQCLEVVTHRYLEGEQVTELQNLPLNDFQCYSCEGNSTHGCSSEETTLITCRGPMTQCLEATGSNELGAPSYTVRGCATHSWCQGLHMAESFRMTHLNVSCCSGNGCNHPARDTQPRKGRASQPGPTHLSLTITLLMSARLWGGTLLWT